jgi:hypothetical protein
VGLIYGGMDAHFGVTGYTLAVFDGRSDVALGASKDFAIGATTCGFRRQDEINAGQESRSCPALFQFELQQFT